MNSNRTQVRIPRWWRMGVLLCWGIALLGMPASAEAHFGEPYAVLIAQPVGPYVMTAYADPDVGTGTFTFEVALNDAPVPADTTLIVGATPEDPHTIPGLVVVKGQSGTASTTFEAEVDFDGEGYWTMQVQVAGSAGAATTSFRVLVTPPYPQWMTTLQCLIPFVVIGAIWIATMRRNTMIRQAAANEGTPTTASDDSEDGLTAQ